MERWMTNFKIVHTEAEAQTMCDEENATGSYYKRKYHRAHYTPWGSRDNTEHGFIVWYVSKTGVCKATPRKAEVGNMKVYKGSSQMYAKTYALPHIKANNIKCKYYAWLAMVLDTDLVKIDGKIRAFDVKTHKEITR